MAEAEGAEHNGRKVDSAARTARVQAPALARLLQPRWLPVPTRYIGMSPRDQLPHILLGGMHQLVHAAGQQAATAEGRKSG